MDPSTLLPSILASRVNAPATALLGSVVISSLLWILYRLLLRAERSPPLPFPPGPPGRPLVGNLGQVSIDHPELDYIRFGKEYDSDVIHIKVLGQHMVCLNSAQAATDLLDKKGSIYCSRPRFTLFEVMGWGLTLTFLQWGPQFKLHRRLFQTTFSQTAVKAFRPIQLAEARKCVRSLVASPSDWKDLTLLLTTSVIFRIAFGQAVSTTASPYCALSAAANEATSNGGIAGSSLVDVFPPARWLPGWMVPSPSLRHARRSRPAIRAIREVPWQANLRDIERGVASPSFMKTHLERHRADAADAGGRRSDMTEADVKGATSAVFIAGGNSTWSTVQSVLLLLTKYPALQRRVREEIDGVVVGEGRLPDFEDRARLPYLEKFVNEVQRVLPMNPLNIPHMSIEDDVYRGMFIPRGSVVFSNTTAMNNDAATYARPEAFDPDRYDRGEPYPVGNFGFGRRKCPGNFLAMATVYIFLATLLATFELEKALGPDGEEIEPEIGGSFGLGGHPIPFDFRLTVRSPKMVQLLNDEQ